MTAAESKVNSAEERAAWQESGREPSRTRDNFFFGPCLQSASHNLDYKQNQIKSSFFIFLSPNLKCFNVQRFLTTFVNLHQCFLKCHICTICITNTVFNTYVSGVQWQVPKLVGESGACTRVWFCVFDRRGRSGWEYMPTWVNLKPGKLESSHFSHFYQFSQHTNFLPFSHDRNNIFY